MMLENTITQDDEGIRLDRWFKRHHAGLPHAMLEKQLRKGLVRLDGKKAKSSDRLHAGQLLTYPETEIAEQARRSKYSASEDELAEARKWVLYKDAQIIVINKPFGLAVQGGSKVARSLDDLMDGLKFDGERPKLVHRLDRDTSGVLVLARTARVAAQMMKMFSGRSIEKTYWALVSNVPQPPVGTIDLPLLKKENPRATGIPGGPEGRDYEVVQVDDQGQKAITEYRVIDSLARRFAHVELKPVTGRMHQLRVHMAAVGCPIVGDHKYGGSMSDAESLGVKNILHLHARRIQIPALPGGKKIDVTAPLPTHMRETFKALGLDVPKGG